MFLFSNKHQLGAYIMIFAGNIEAEVITITEAGSADTLKQLKAISKSQDLLIKYLFKLLKEIGGKYDTNHRHHTVYIRKNARPYSKKKCGVS